MSEQSSKNFARSFADLDRLDEVTEAKTQSTLVANQFLGLVTNLDDVKTIKEVTTEFVTRLKNVLPHREDEIGTQSPDESEEDNPPVETPEPIPAKKTFGEGFHFLRKDDGGIVWLAVYSNKFRDEDAVPEIISEASHQRFDKLLKEGKVPYPELWLYHVPVVWGKANFHTYDDNGFTIAAGVVTPGMEWVVDRLEKSGQTLGVSHGMPSEYISRDPDDPTIITEHVTIEISPLPLDAAANKLTHFELTETKQMSITQEDKERLETMGLTEADVAALEKETKSLAEQAIAAGVDFKEAGIDTAVVEAITETPATEETVTDVELEVSATLDGEDSKAEGEEEAEGEKEDAGDVAETVLMLAEEIQGIKDAIADIASRVASIEESENKAASPTEDLTPAASLLDQVKSIVGRSEAHVDGRVLLAKDGPEEQTPAPSTNTSTGIGLVGRLRSANQQKSQALRQ